MTSSQNLDTKVSEKFALISYIVLYDVFVCVHTSQDIHYIYLSVYLYHLFKSNDFFRK